MLKYNWTKERNTNVDNHLCDIVVREYDDEPSDVVFLTDAEIQWFKEAYYPSFLADNIEYIYFKNEIELDEDGEYVDSCNLDVKYDKEDAISLLKVELSNRMIEAIEKYSCSHKSPYSNSFYNAEVSWNEKPENSYRVSGHWNFYSRGEIHCEIDFSQEELEANPLAQEIFDQFEDDIEWEYTIDCDLVCQYRNGKYHIVEIL